MSAGTSTQNSLFTFQPTETNMYSTIFVAISLLYPLHSATNACTEASCTQEIMIYYPTLDSLINSVNTHLRHRLPRDA